MAFCIAELPSTASARAVSKPAISNEKREGSGLGQSGQSASRRQRRHHHHRQSARECAAPWRAQGHHGERHRGARRRERRGDHPHRRGAHLRGRRRHHRIRQAAAGAEPDRRDRDARRGEEADHRGGARHAARRRARADDGLPFPRRRGRHAARPARDQARAHSRRGRHAAPAAPRRHREGAADDPVGRSDPGEGRARGRAGRRDHRGRSGRRRGRVRPQGAGREAPAACA